jgi:hypothetical protein
MIKKNKQKDYTLVKIQLSNHDDIDIDWVLHRGSDNEEDTIKQSVLDIEKYVFSLSLKQSKVLFFKSLGFKSNEIVKLADLASINDYYKQCNLLKIKYKKSINT